MKKNKEGEDVDIIRGPGAMADYLEKVHWGNKEALSDNESKLRKR